MIDDTQRAKVERFLGDRVMADTVFGILKSSFLRKKGVRDVQILAAERLAFDLLEDGWQELQKYQLVNPEKDQKPGQIGL